MKFDFCQTTTLEKRVQIIEFCLQIKNVCTPYIENAYCKQIRKTRSVRDITTHTRQRSGCSLANC